MNPLKLLLPILIVLASFAPNWQFFEHRDQFAVHFLDVGQGDSVLIRTPTNCTIFVDGGPLNNAIDILEKFVPP